MSTTRSIRLVAGALLLVVATLVALVPTPAWAHASLLDSSPGQDERLDDLPSRARLEFSESMVAPAYIIVTAPDGSSVTEGEPRVDGAVVTQDLAEGPDGTYTMAYRAVSEDGHPVSGEVTFAVGATSPASGAATPTIARSTRQPATAEPVEGSAGGPPSRRVVAVGVGAGLFLLAGLMLLLARRTAP